MTKLRKLDISSEDKYSLKCFGHIDYIIVHRSEYYALDVKRLQQRHAGQMPPDQKYNII